MLVNERTLDVDRKFSGSTGDVKTSDHEVERKNINDIKTLRSLCRDCSRDTVRWTMKQSSPIIFYQIVCEDRDKTLSVGRIICTYIVIGLDLVIGTCRG